MTRTDLDAIRARDDACDGQYAHISARDRRALLECVESLAAAARAVSAASDALIVMGDGRAYFDSGAATHEFRAARAALRARLEQMSHD